MIKDNAIVFDLDGTLSRTPQTEAKDPTEWDWARFVELARQAPVDKYMLDVWDKHLLGSERIILTSRPHQMRSMTYVWCKKYLNFLPEHDQLIMMNQAELEKQDKITTLKELNKAQGRYKKEHLTRLMKSYNILAVYDDKEEVCSMANELGLRTFKVSLCP